MPVVKIIPAYSLDFPHSHEHSHMLLPFLEATRYITVNFSNFLPDSSSGVPIIELLHPTWDKSSSFEVPSLYDLEFAASAFNHSALMTQATIVYADAAASHK